MKKWIALAMMLALVFSCAAASTEATCDAQEYVAANGYDLLYVTDIFINDDAEADKNGNFPDAVDNGVYVQGCFGTVDMSKGEAEAVNVGFDEDNIFSMGLAKDCVVLMPKDWSNPVENVVIDDPKSWCEARMEEAMKNAEEKPGYCEFYALFELNKDGNLTRLEYYYMP